MSDVFLVCRCPFIFTICFNNKLMLWLFRLNSISHSIINSAFDFDTVLYQMTFVRLLEVLPLVVEHMSSSLFKESSFCGVEGDSGITISKAVDFKWFYDLIDWGKSQLIIIRSHWKKSVAGVLNIFKELTDGASHNVINTIKGILESGEVLVSFVINFYCIRMFLPAFAADGIFILFVAQTILWYIN